MITEFINGLKGLQPLTGPDDIQPGRVICMEYDNHRYQHTRWFYKVIKRHNDYGDWVFKAIRIKMDDRIIDKSDERIYRFPTFGSVANSYSWYWFEHYPELKYDPLQQGDTDEDI